MGRHGSMTTSKDRQIRRLEKALDDCREARELSETTFKETRERLENELKSAQLRIAVLRRENGEERLNRIAAQRGLVAYMKEHGLADRIGYDPDTDPVVQQEIAEGRIPPRTDPRVLKEIAATVVAARHA